MSKKISSLAFLFMFIFSSGWAQLAGTYTICKSGCDYATINAAVSDLKAKGVSGPTIIKVTPAVYNEKVVISSIPGTSQTNTITFSSPYHTEISSNSDSIPDSNYTLWLNGASNISFQNFKITRTKATGFYETYTTAVLINSGCSNITFDGCQIESPICSTGYETRESKAVVYSDGDNDNNIVFFRDTIKGGTYGICFYGKGLQNPESGIQIIGNQIFSSYKTINLVYQTKTQILYCELIGTSTMPEFSAGISITNSSDIVNITANTLNQSAAQYGIYLSNISTTTGNPSILIANNFIMAGANHGYGLYASYTDRLDIYYNTIVMTNKFLHSYTGVFLYTSKYAATNFQNNIINLSQAGTGIYIINPSTINKMDYNDYFVSSNANVGLWNSKTGHTLSDWQNLTGMDDKSLNIDPKYENHFSLIQEKGTPITGITDDIYGFQRSNKTPDIGAIEYPDNYLLAGIKSVDACTNIFYTPINTSTSKCGTINKWYWTFAGGKEADGNSFSTKQFPQIKYPLGGTYSIQLKIMSDSGCTDSTSQTIWVDKDCVFPGDANYDNTANNVDVLNIGIAFNEVGTLRDSATSKWTGQPAKDWAGMFLNNHSYKQADCNGDGIVNLNDLKPITQNYGRVHLKTAYKNGDSTDAPLYVVMDKDSVKAGDTVRGHVFLGTAAKPLTNVYGVAFNISYNPKNVDSGTINMNFGKCWFGTKGKDMLTYLHDDYAKGELAVTICRTDKKNISGQGDIGTLSFVLPDNIAGKVYISYNFIVNPTFAKLIDFNEKEFPVYLLEDSFIAYQRDSGSTSTEELLVGSCSLLVWPNPATNKLTFQSGNTSAQTTVCLYNLTGKLLKFYTLPTGVKEKSFNIEELASGFYLLEVKNGNLVERRKLLVK